MHTIVSENIFNRVLKRLKTYSRYLLILICIVLMASLIKNIYKIKEAQEEINQLQARVEELREKNDGLKQSIEVAKSEEFIEKQLRDKLGLAKEGEIVIVLPEEEVLRKLAPEDEEEEVFLPDPNWKKWMKLFF